MKQTTWVVLAAAVVLAVPAHARAEEPKMTAEQKAEMDAMMKAGAVGPQHKALQATAGNYDVKVKSWQDPNQPPMEESGTVTRSMIFDGRVLVEDFKGSMMGQPFTGHGMRGFDNVTGKHWSTWNDSMSTGIMLSEGTCDAKDVCTFVGSWHDPLTKKKVTSRMTSRWTSPTVEVFEMHAPGRDGKEMKMMEMTYTKK